MKRIDAVVLCAGIGMVGAGCSERLLRETVFANTESLIGVSVAQDPRTQGYELKAGFARSELFLVPTDKTIARDGETGSETEIRQGADRTANVLAEIGVGVASRGPGGSGEITQRIAVGDIAVRSGAAVALMARDTELASAVNPELAAKDVTPDRAEMLDRIEALRRATTSPVRVSIGGPVRTFAGGRELGDVLARQIATPAQLDGEWDLRNARVKASDAQLAELIDRWSALLGL